MQKNSTAHVSRDKGCKIWGSSDVNKELDSWRSLRSILRPWMIFCLSALSSSLDEELPCTRTDSSAFNMPSFAWSWNWLGQWLRFAWCHSSHAHWWHNETNVFTRSVLSLTTARSCFMGCWLSLPAMSAKCYRLTSMRVHTDTTAHTPTREQFSHGYA